MYFPLRLRLYMFLELYITVGQIDHDSIFLPPQRGEDSSVQITPPVSSSPGGRPHASVVGAGRIGVGERGGRNFPWFMKKSRPRPHPQPPNSSNLPISNLSLRLGLQGSVKEGHDS